jgi:hypothetical protein
LIFLLYATRFSFFNGIIFCATLLKQKQAEIKEMIQYSFICIMV